MFSISCVFARFRPLNPTIWITYSHPTLFTLFNKRVSNIDVRVGFKLWTRDNMAETVSPVFRVWALVCSPPFLHCKRWQRLIGALSLHCVVFNTWFRYLALRRRSVYRAAEEVLSWVQCFVFFLPIVNGPGARLGHVSVLRRSWCSVCATGKTRVVLILLLCCNITSDACSLLVVRVLL